MWEQILISSLPGLFKLLFGDAKGFDSLNGDHFSNLLKNPQTYSNMLGLFGQGYQTGINYQNQQQNLDWQRNFAMQQFNYNRMLNDRSFFQSLPASQVQNFISAGLSPDLLYGQLSSMDFGNNQSLQMPNASSPFFAGLENANLSKDLGKKESEIGLNLSQKAVNEVDKAIKDLEELYLTMTMSGRIKKSDLEAEFQRIENQLIQSNVEQNVINNMKLATSLGLVKSFDKDGNIVYQTSSKFREICSFYFKDIEQRYDIGEQELKNLQKKFEDIEKSLKLKDSEILINSVAYQQDVMNLIASAVGAGIDLKQDSEGHWIIDYTGDTGDVAGVVAMGLIDSVLSLVGIKFTLGKNASKVLGRHEVNSTSKTDNTTRSFNTELPYNGDRGK